MMWTFFLVAATLVMLAGMVSATVRALGNQKGNRLLDPVKILSISVGVSSLLLLFPMFLSAYREFEGGIIQALLISLNTMIKLFVAGSEYEELLAFMPEISKTVLFGYRTLLSTLFVAAPLMTFGFVLSFFKNLSARFRFAVSIRKNIAVFSDLSERSLVLANDLKKDYLIVFTDVFEKVDEENYELRERAKELGAICFKRDITTIDFRKKKAGLKIFILGENRVENIRQSIKLIKTLRDRPDTDMYILSAKDEDDLVIVNALKSDDENAPYPAIHVHRTNEVTSLIFRTLHKKGYESVFHSARELSDGDKEITAVVIGMGLHGTEMVKALPWFCQMDGYKAHIYAFEKDPRAKDRFWSLCPELTDDAHNGRFDLAGDAHYEIVIHPDCDVTTKTFDDTLASLPPATYVFVATGDDDRNLAVALKLRMLYKRRGVTPVIHAIVYNPEKRHTLNGIHNFKGRDYQIEFIGDMKETFSAEVILGSDLEKKALARHTKWGNTQRDIDAFWHYSYNYKSSVASAIHHDVKIQCGIPGADRLPEERDPQARQALRILEHSRWNAYMRSEGYIYSETRDDIAKMHPCLVPFSELPPEEQEKDDD